MKVLVITEDHTRDQYIVKPVLQRLFEDLGCKNTVVDVCRQPRIRGVAQAMDRQILSEVFGNHPQADLFLLIVDSDCVQSRENKLKSCLEYAEGLSKRMAGCLAREEVEIWALALHRDDLPDKWSIVRQNCTPDETYFEPLARQRNWMKGVGKGRKEAMKGLSQNWRGLKSCCREIEELGQAIQERLNRS